MVPDPPPLAHAKQERRAFPPRRGCALEDPPPRRTPVAATLSAYREPPCPNRWSGFFSHNGGLSGANDRLRGAASRRPTSGLNDPSRTQPSRGPTAPTLRPASTTPLTNPNGTRSRSLVREADRGPVGGDRCQSLATGPFACRSTPASKQSEVLAHSPWCKRTSKRIMTPRAPLLSPRSKRVRPGLGATAFLLAPATAALSQRRRSGTRRQGAASRRRASTRPRGWSSSVLFCLSSESARRSQGTSGECASRRLLGCRFPIWEAEA